MHKHEIAAQLEPERERHAAHQAERGARHERHAAAHERKHAHHAAIIAGAAERRAQFEAEQAAVRAARGK